MKVYLLYTGGTIGCVGKPLAPMDSASFAAAFRQWIEPMIASRLRQVTIATYDFLRRPLESANTQPSDWVTIARKIADNYNDHDAFVVLHGTDTMAWTASALSFLLPRGLKPIVLTGAQVPMFDRPPGGGYGLRYNTDAIRNVLGAFAFLPFKVPEVCFYFADRLYRGNRIVKSNSMQFDGFASPNYPALGTYGVTPTLNREFILPPPAVPLDAVMAQTKQDLAAVAATIDNKAVIQFKVFPPSYAGGVSLLSTILDTLGKGIPSLGGIVFEAYGAGNIPKDGGMAETMVALHRQGTVLIDCTQVFAGGVDYEFYAAGAWLNKCGVVSGRDMTPIAALTKLIVLWARHPDGPAADIARGMTNDLAGEMTLPKNGAAPDGA
jgi:L-asparaginase